MFSQTIWGILAYSWWAKAAPRSASKKVTSYAESDVEDEDEIMIEPKAIVNGEKFEDDGFADIDYSNGNGGSNNHGGYGNGTSLPLNIPSTNGQPPLTPLPHRFKLH